MDHVDPPAFVVCCVSVSVCVVLFVRFVRPSKGADLGRRPPTLPPAVFATDAPLYRRWSTGTSRGWFRRWATPAEVGRSPPRVPPVYTERPAVSSSVKARVDFSGEESSPATSSTTGARWDAMAEDAFSERDVRRRKTFNGRIDSPFLHHHDGQRMPMRSALPGHTSSHSPHRSFRRSTRVGAPVPARAVDRYNPPGATTPSSRIPLDGCRPEDASGRAAAACARRNDARARRGGDRRCAKYHSLYKRSTLFFISARMMRPGLDGGGKHPEVTLALANWQEDAVGQPVKILELISIQHMILSDCQTVLYCRLYCRVCPRLPAPCRTTTMECTGTLHI